jgi:hypothetical protein
MWFPVGGMILSRIFRHAVFTAALPVFAGLSIIAGSPDRESDKCVQ